MKVPATSPAIPKTYIPHAFSEKELSNLFKACDEIKSGKNIQEKLRKLEVPVFFRLLYSSGLRTTEIRQLRRENVNLRTGVINIRYTKGYNERRIVLHDTMRRLLIHYDKSIEELIPDRNILFPSFEDKCHLNSWVVNQFNEMWYKYNETKARAYDLRHHYAIENINKWRNTGFEAHDNLLALSKSMGHRKLESTMYYYSLVPKLADIIENISGETYDKIIPNLPEDEE
jgi:integrase